MASSSPLSSGAGTPAIARQRWWWVVRNATANWRPFHIHVNEYQVVAVNGKPVPVRSYEDTTAVPPFGEITMRTRYLDFPRRWVYHCHILLHEDHGMMGTVRALA